MKKQAKNIDVVIFDFDGTIREISWKGLKVAYEAIIKARGKDSQEFFRDLESFKKWFNLDWHKNIEEITGLPYVESPTWNALFHAHYDPFVTLFHWTDGLLCHLSKQYHLAILSSSSVLSVQKELGEVSRFFDPNLIVGAEKVTRLKPHPEGIHYILNYLGIAPEHALIIGDTHLDFQAGKAAGIWTGLVGWGMLSLDGLKSLDAEMYFEHPSELFLL